MSSQSVSRLGLAGVALLESLYQHRLLSTVQLHDLHTPATSMQWTRKLLARLANLDLVAVTRAPGGLGLWYLTERGAITVETIGNRAEPRRKLVRPEQAAGPLQAHTLAVNEVGVAFVKAARLRREDECGPFAWRHEIIHPLGPPPGRRYSEYLIADALLTYQHVEPDAATFHYRFVELDRATIQAETLAAKLARYARLYAYTPAPDKPGRRMPLWAKSYPVFPTVLVVLAGKPARRALERRRANVLALCADDDELRTTSEVEIAVALLDDLTDQGPFAAIFRTLVDPAAPRNWLGEPG
jgi:hypothetical protein